MQSYEKRMKEQVGKLKQLEKRIAADMAKSPEMPKGRIKVRNIRGYGFIGPAGN